MRWFRLPSPSQAGAHTVQCKRGSNGKRSHHKQGRETEITVNHTPDQELCARVWGGGFNFCSPPQHHIMWLFALMPRTGLMSWWQQVDFQEAFPHFHMVLIYISGQSSWGGWTRTDSAPCFPSMPGQQSLETLAKAKPLYRHTQWLQIGSDILTVLGTDDRWLSLVWVIELSCFFYTSKLLNIILQDLY